MGGARHPGLRAGVLWRRTRRGDCAGGHGDGPPAAKADHRSRDGDTMTFDPGMPLAIELALFALAVLVLLVAVARPHPGAGRVPETVGRVPLAVGRVPRSEETGGPAEDGGPGAGPAAYLTLAGLAVIFGLTFF